MTTEGNFPVPGSVLLHRATKMSCVGYAELSYQAIKCLEGNFTGETDNWFQIAVADEENPGRLLFLLEAAATYPLFYTEVLFW